MNSGKVLVYILIILSIPLVFALNIEIAAAGDHQQQPTVSIPTVTGTPSGPIAVIWSDPEPQINVRSGPGTYHPIVGILQNRQEVPALGVTVNGAWVQIGYHGVEGGVAWVYSALVKVSGQLPIVAEPPTPTPLITATIDPTLAAQFIVEIPPTRLPTFTPPAPLIIPTLAPGIAGEAGRRLPVGFVILGLGIIGFFGVIISFLRQR